MNNFFFNLPSCFLKGIMNSVGLHNFHILISDPYLLFHGPHRGGLEVTHDVQPFKKADYAWSDKQLMRLALGYSKNSKRKWEVSLSGKSKRDPRAVVVVSGWHMGRSKGYKQTVTAVRSKYFHF